ncbi:MAG: methyl-accepting chemotaxis protein, partial [Clostridiales bacterium]|nr:methyl-accepting chemotaxis protein [Clostridiales bacterium]
SAAASEELSSQAEQMKGTVSAFTLKKSLGSVSELYIAAPALSSGASKQAAVINGSNFGKY